MTNINLNKVLTIGNNTISKRDLLLKLKETYGPTPTRQEILTYINNLGGSIVAVRWIFNNKSIRLSRARYNLDLFELTTPADALKQLGNEIANCIENALYR